MIALAAVTAAGVALGYALHLQDRANRRRMEATR
jgi:archaellin